MSIATNIVIPKKSRRIYTSISFIIARWHIFVYSKLFVLMAARMSHFFRSHSEPVVSANGRARTDIACIEIVS